MNPVPPPTPPTAAMPAGADPSAPQDVQQDDGFTVCIHVSTDKQFTVSVEGAGQAEPAEEDEAAEQAGGVPCKTVKEALTLALEVIRNDGVMPKEADDDFQKGFSNPSTQGAGL